MHQDIVINRDGAAHMLKVAKFVDELLVRYYRMEPYYRAATIDDMVGQLAITLAPHTSAGVLCRISRIHRRAGRALAPVRDIGEEEELRRGRGHDDASPGRADKLLEELSAVKRRRHMDAPLTLTLNIDPSEVDDEVHDMEVVEGYGLEFYNIGREEGPAGRGEGRAGEGQARDREGVLRASGSRTSAGQRR